MTWAMILLGTTAVVAVLVLVTAGSLAYVRYRYGQIDKLSLDNLSKGTPDKAMNILLVGNNSREVLDGQQANAFGSPDEVGGARSDVSRIERDHEFLKVLSGSVAKRGLSNPLTLNAVVGSVAPHLQVDSGFSLPDMISLVRQYRSVNPNSVPTATLPVTVLDQSYVYRGSNLGDVVLPAQPADNQAIAQFLDQPVPPRSGPEVAVQVEDGSGRASRGGQVEDSLRTLGYAVTDRGTTPQAADPSETVIYYAPGQRAQAQRLLANLSGSVVIGQAPTPPGTDLVLVSGSDLKVTPPAAPAAPNSAPVPPTRAAAGTPVSSPGATPAQAPLATFNPAACPPGSSVVTAR